MDNSNASRDGKCLRYKKGWQNIRYNKESFIDSFLKRFEMMENDLTNFLITSPKAKIYRGDSRKLLENTVEKPFKLCVTSPPYLNSFDYSDIYRPELFLGKFVKTNEDLKRLRLNTIRSHVQVNWTPPEKNDFGYLYRQIINEIIKREEILWHKKIPLMIQAYFEDMERILSILKSKARKDASLWIVVSTSAYAGVEVPVDLIFADIGTKVGWNLEEIIVTRYLRHSTQNAKRWLSGESVTKRLRESIIIFKGIT
jgi:RNAse (barnase) inhibitor barstar